MKEIKRTRLSQAVGSNVCSRSIIFGPPAMLLFVMSIVTGISFSFDGNVRVTAAPQAQNRLEELRPPVLNLPRLASFGPTLAESAPHEDHLWRENPRVGRENPRVGLRKSGAENGGLPKSYRALSLDVNAQRKVLRHAPMEFSVAASQNQVVMTLPMPDGTLSRFRVEESPVMSPLLAARFPAIRTYRGRGLDDPTATTRFDVTPAGFHAIVLSTHGTVIIEPAGSGQARKYVSYNQDDAPKGAGSFNCRVSDAESSTSSPSKQLLRKSDANLSSPTGSTLRTYRLALAATAEFTQTYGGGTVSGTLAVITTMINAVNAIFERDLAIRMKLIDNEDAIIFTNTATDGYTSDNATTLFNQNQALLDQRIGTANYDVGMVFDGLVFAYLPGHFIFEGQGRVRSVCVNGQKGQGVTILRSTEPSTTSAIWVVAHEMGHKFGGLHSFNGGLEDCGTSRTSDGAYEPGSGSTIMGYRGGLLPDGRYFPLCGAEDLHSADTYFHAANIEQIVNYTTFGNGSFCPSISSTENNPPNVDAGADYTIPANTPFVLTATGSDPEADALTYCWEQFDLGAPGPPHTDNGNRPIFRSFAPVPTSARTFPQLADILSSTPTFGESLPTTNRTMTFRITVRDNHPGGGGVNTAAMRVRVVAGGGPFAVTQPGASSSWTAGSNQTVTWDVANSSSAPVNCTNVRVLLSIDGGSSFPFTLASSVPNSGSATITVPNAPTSTARIKVESVGNIFFNISLPNFAITPNSTLAPTLLTEANTNRAVALDSVTLMRDLFPVTTPHNFSLDQRTRIMLFAFGLELMPGEDVSVVTAQAEDSAHRIFPLTVEYVGKVPTLNWLTQVNVRLPDGLANAGDVLVSVSLRGAVSNKAVITIR
ncbi:MAG: reprolysin-like metallopeptidase [Acidobacteriota bacterium]